MSLAGKNIALSDFAGKPIVLNFWASWCAPCRMEMPYFDNLFKALKEDVHFVMVNLTTALSGSGETPEKAKNFIKENGYQFPVYLDIKQEGAITYAVRNIPQTYILNPKGEVVFSKAGVMTEEELQEAINMAMK